MPIALGEQAPGVRASASADSSSVPGDWRAYKSTGSVASRNRLVVHYMQTQVGPVARRIHAGLPKQVDLDDLIQQGYLGLVDAMDRFDLDRDIRFETFSRRRIFGAIQDYLRSIDTVPRLTRARSRHLQVARDRFRMTHGRPPSEEELRPLIDLPETVFRRCVTEDRPASIVPFSGVRPESEDATGEDGDVMHAFEDLTQPGPHVDAARRDLQRWLIRGFDTRDRLIIVLYYYEKMTMLEIGRTVGISESRVSQRLDSILACLRSRLKAANAEHEFVFG